MPDVHRFTLVRKAAICAALATLLAPAVEAAKPRRTPTTSPVSATAHERLKQPQQQAPGAVQPAEATEGRRAVDVVERQEDARIGS